ncbi:unnamed protein product [Soboliphyme baturini]|uniref:Protein CUSTOS n=1 Tax=Soboliphyme baturini TaxID=241478 RepID=A0A183J046_9BILA|nr:unnamed protein product [Soboliphyme baturini]
MGAAKKEHKGRFVIGDTDPKDSALHNRSKKEIETLESVLESQFTQCISEHLKHRDKRRRGLGYEGSDSGLPKNDSFSTLVDTKTAASVENGEC